MEEGSSPTPDPQAGITVPSPEERTWAMVAHLSGCVAAVVFPLVVPLVIYLVKKDESEFLADQAREALNFHITVALASILSCVLFFACGIGVLLLWLVGIATLVLSIVAGIRSYDGVRYRYPYALRLV